ncbi:hypothetical protein Asppvi_010952 [Aspergillus pseudoviridinutans]|uniref:Uncharacterized protein n=1 Tax=Aspergillus pseudoviridinutans TaxID=1517512 RepID=A0A9P3BIY9_9EURO|nr:uncharacterized protein Asppvi_010952 [Aspergillus pseudoviridinutans]GIJ91977.1 hypothetical protein Asppvi_010952 [Aspergillus pseudoviridinutans]
MIADGSPSAAVIGDHCGWIQDEFDNNVEGFCCRRCEHAYLSQLLSAGDQLENTVLRFPACTGAVTDMETVTPGRAAQLRMVMDKQYYASSSWEAISSRGNDVIYFDSHSLFEGDRSCQPGNGYRYSWFLVPMRADALDDGTVVPTTQPLSTGEGVIDLRTYWKTCQLTGSDPWIDLICDYSIAMRSGTLPDFGTSGLYGPSPSTTMVVRGIFERPCAQRRWVTMPFQRVSTAFLVHLLLDVSKKQGMECLKYSL